MLCAAIDGCKSIRTYNATPGAQCIRQRDWIVMNMFPALAPWAIMVVDISAPCSSGGPCAYFVHIVSFRERGTGTYFMD